MKFDLNQAINTLNQGQRQAVEQIYGPVLVLAGPGTGKTHMLTTRVAAILNSDAGANAENILCLTFTENAAVEMRNRLQKWIGAEAYKVKISTFHGFCQWVIDENSQLFYPLVGNREVIDDLGKALTYRSVIKSKKWTHFSSVWDDFAFQYDFLKAVSDLKREQLNPETFAALIPEEKERLEASPENFYKRKFKDFLPGDWKPQARQKIDTKIEKMYELAELWTAYEAALKKEGYYDFDDLINWVVRTLAENETLRYDLQERFQWILTDEYQDTNQAQNSILWQLVEGVSSPNLLAVGDDDQSIYRFQGASVANVQDFRAKFPDRLEITLSKNYRSHAHILEAAYASVSKNSDRANQEKKLEAQKETFLSPSPGRIVQAALSSRMAEIAFIADEIKKQLKSGVPPHEIAVLVRKNREIEELATELPKLGVRVAAQVATDIFENERVRQLILMLEVFAEPKASDKLFDLLHADFFGIPPEVLLKLSLDRNRDESFVETLLRCKNVDSKLAQFVDFYTETKRDFHQSRSAVVAEKFLYESGLAAHLTEHNLLNDWQAIKKFVSWLREQAKSEKFRTHFRFEKELPEILNRIELHRTLGIKILPDRLPQDRDSIQIMTAHKSKGLEFEVVFVPGLEDRKWGNPRSNRGLPLPQLKDQSFDENQEERRLFFVALTRAKAQLYLSYAMTDFSGKDKVPSLFWHEIPEALSTQQEADELEVSLQNLLPVFFAQAEKTLTTGEKALLQERVKNFKWSVSSLQTYLDCPRKFLYQNLYRFPRKPLPQLALGVSLHQSLEQLFEKMKTGKADLAYLVEAYESALRGQNLPFDEFDKFLSHGREVLTNYYEQKLQDFSEAYPFGYELEYDFARFKPVVDDIFITGKMDKIVYLDAKKTRVKIVDYKSGRPKPIVRGEAYWRQLVFYDLLARQSRGSDWIMETAEIEFLTPDSTGKLGQRSWQVTAEDRAQVIEELKDSHQKILNLEFPLLPNLAGDKEIDYWQNFGQ